MAEKKIVHKRKICVVTGTRAEYGLLQGLIKKIIASAELELQLVVTGMHLSPEFGNTYKEIEADGFIIDKKVEILLSSDSHVGIGKSVGLGVMEFSEVFNQLEPEIILLLGDRFEIFAAAAAATMLCKPIAHLHGGELTEGAFDEAIRHSVTKMSHLHFTSCEQHKKRVIQLGEQPERVFNVGALGIDNILSVPLLSRKELEKAIEFNLAQKNILITFHSVTLESDSAEQQFSELLKAVDELEETHLIFTKSNSDPGGRVINAMIDDYVKENRHKSIAFTSMGQLRYLSALQFMDALVGNSSSGIIEAPSFNLAAINIGDRQKGRVRADSVIDCDPSYASINNALKKIDLPDFKKKLSNTINPYGDGNTSDKIINILQKFPFTNILKKSFYDIHTNE